MSWACRSDPVTAHAPAQEIVIHATCVALEGRAALIRGAAGQGKSGLALQLIALGATLVADDRTRLWRNDDRLIADAPDTIRGRIEARGLGILHLPQTGPAPVACVVDLDRSETDRLPSLCHETVMDLRLPSFGKSPHPHFPAVILLYLRYGTIS
ncbi:MAG: HPr kinase/phosphatase C-terminal domain-containing protein [Roseovarius sp.]|uniref:HPr kinase/phosphorylase n=1 Tax=Roseovarius sp. TaxID=1486281 RepID=UPI0032EF7240